jgi:hypothetical protein
VTHTSAPWDLGIDSVGVTLQSDEDREALPVLLICKR